jgi:DNA-binding response OmpR family regulator
MGKKVLVVDDEFEIRDLLSRFLTEEGYEVILASNGEEALKLA